MGPTKEQDKAMTVHRLNSDWADDCDVQKLSLQNETGHVTITVCTAFPGIDLLYVDAQTDRIAQCADPKDTALEIHYCTDGELLQTTDTMSFRLAPGDLCVSVRKSCSCDCSFPTRLYRGISILLTPEKAAPDVPEFAEGVDPVQIVQTLCSQKERRLLQGDPRLTNLFSDLMHPPRQNRMNYCRMKVLELFYLLRDVNRTDAVPQLSSLPDAQVQLAARAADVLAQEEGQTFTVQQLAKKCGASQTYLQTCIKNVFGMTASAYIRKQKMQRAVHALTHTSKSVMEIAAQAGYENASKFSAAFAKTMGELPTQYRKRHRKP